MMTSETIFANGVPVGKIVIDTSSREIAFVPNANPSKLPVRDFDSLDEMRSAIVAAYQYKDQGATS